MSIDSTQRGAACAPDRTGHRTCVMCHKKEPCTAYCTVRLYGTVPYRAREEGATKLSRSPPTQSACRDHVMRIKVRSCVARSHSDFHAAHPNGTRHLSKRRARVGRDASPRIQDDGGETETVPRDWRTYNMSCLSCIMYNDFGRDKHNEALTQSIENKARK